MKNILDWSDKYSIGVEEIDSQHKKLFDLLNEFNEALNSPKGSKMIAFRNAAQKAVEYVQYHFKSEEKIMEQYDYPGISKQREQHKEFIKEILKDTTEYDDRNPKNAIIFLHFLCNWITHHIAHLDHDLGIYIQSVRTMKHHE